MIDPATLAEWEHDAERVGVVGPLLRVREMFREIRRLRAEANELAFQRDVNAKLLAEARADVERLTEDGMIQACAKVSTSPQMCPRRDDKSPHVCWDEIKKKGATHPMPHHCGFCGKEWP